MKNQKQEQKPKPKLEKLSDSEHEALAGGRYGFAASTGSSNRAPI